MIIDHDDDTDTSGSDKDNNSNAVVDGELDEDIVFRLEGNPVVGLRSWLPWLMLRRLSLFLANPLSSSIVDV